MLKAMMARAREVHGAELEGDEAAESGFTLIELMVVLLILAILMAIAIPTFLGVTGGANDRAAQSNLTNAFTEASAIYQSNGQSFTGLTPGNFQASAPEFTWTTGGVSSQNQVDVLATNDGIGVGLAVRSQTGYCWYLLNLENTPSSTTLGGTAVKVTTAGTFYGKSKTTETNCYASDAATASSSSYSTAGQTANLITPASSGNI
jgi:type IV pilus assembly protein PilA